MGGTRLELHPGGHVLCPHPDTPARAVPRVTCSFVWKSAGEWAFDFAVPVPPAALRLPEPAVPERTDGLWRHTCFEIFLMDPANGSYLEFNLSPSGRWAAYRFDGYRSGMRALGVTGPRIITSNGEQFRLAMGAHLRALGLDEESIRLLEEASPPLAESRQFALSAALDDSSLHDERQWLASVAAVIEEKDRTKSYWALAHPSEGPPDFHHPDCFVLELPPPAGR